MTTEWHLQCKVKEISGGAILHLFERLFLISWENNRDCHITVPLSLNTMEAQIKGAQLNKRFRTVYVYWSCEIKLNTSQGYPNLRHRQNLTFAITMPESFSGPPPLYQDFCMRHERPIKITIFDLTTRLKGNSKHIFLVIHWVHWGREQGLHLRMSMQPQLNQSKCFIIVASLRWENQWIWHLFDLKNDEDLRESLSSKACKKEWKKRISRLFHAAIFLSFVSRIFPKMLWNFWVHLMH